MRWIYCAGAGGYACAVKPGGAVTVYGPGGKARSWAGVPGADAAIVTDDGAFTLAYWRFDALRPCVTFLDSTGRVYWAMSVDGAVWCADCCCSRGAATFVVGTGEGYVYVAEVGGGRKRYRRWRAPGAVVSIGIDTRGGRVYLGTWQKSALVSASLRGAPGWKNDCDPACLQYVDVLDASDRVFVRSVPNSPNRSGTFSLLDSRGRELLRGRVDAWQDVRARASPNGLYVCQGYNKLIEHKKKSTMEKRAVLLSADGSTLWEKGSLFFQANPILVTSEGYVLVDNGAGKLFVIGSSGRI